MRSRNAARVIVTSSDMFKWILNQVCVCVCVCVCVRERERERESELASTDSSGRVL